MSGCLLACVGQYVGANGERGLACDVEMTLIRERPFVLVYLEPQFRCLALKSAPMMNVLLKTCMKGDNSFPGNWHPERS